MIKRIASLGAALALALVSVSQAASAETLEVRLDKAEILRLDSPASVVVVGNPNIADVTVENPTLLFIMGRSAGETNMLILDEVGDVVANLDLTVIGELDRHVTVHRDTIQISTFSCDPRCIEVSNPSDVERERQFAAGDDEDDLGGGVPAGPAAADEDAETEDEQG
jgi:Flp pilus assembly secretin CpaC